MMGTPPEMVKCNSKQIMFLILIYGFISTSNVKSEQKEQPDREKYVFYCSVSQMHINPE